jgi:hypothetical protein
MLDEFGQDHVGQRNCAGRGSSGPSPGYRLAPAEAFQAVRLCRLDTVRRDSNRPATGWLWRRNGPHGSGTRPWQGRPRLYGSHLSERNGRSSGHLIEGWNVYGRANVGGRAMAARWPRDGCCAPRTKARVMAIVVDGDNIREQPSSVYVSCIHALAHLHHDGWQAFILVANEGVMRMPVAELHKPPLARRVTYRVINQRLGPEFWSWVRADLLERHWRLRLAAWTCGLLLLVTLPFIIISVVNGWSFKLLSITWGAMVLGIVLGGLMGSLTPLARFGGDRRLRHQGLAPDGSPLPPPVHLIDSNRTGWFPDLSGHFSWRYWDGGRWTDGVSNGGTVLSDPLP